MIVTSGHHVPTAWKLLSKLSCPILKRAWQRPTLHLESLLLILVSRTDQQPLVGMARCPSWKIVTTTRLEEDVVVVR